MRASRILVFVCLALAGGLGPGLDHSIEHEIGAAFGGGPRFEAGHDRPISEKHVETAQGSLDDGCYACASRHNSSSSVWLGLARERLPGPAGAAAAEMTGTSRRHELNRSLGRAPPA